MSVQVSIINNSSVVQPGDLDNVIADIQAQIDGEFGQAWDVCATISANLGGIPIYIQDEPSPSDPQGALGFHSIMGNGSPYGVIFAQFALDNGVSWSVVLDHEILELLADLLIDSTVFIDDGSGQGTGWIIYQEVADPVESLSYIGQNGTLLSDFVYPQFYLPSYVGAVDYLGQLAGPLTLASGGYVAVNSILCASGWQVLTASMYRTLAAKAKEMHAQKVAQPLELHKRHGVVKVRAAA